MIRNSLHDLVCLYNRAEEIQDSIRDAQRGLGAAIRQVRKESGMTLREMARQLDVSASFVCDMELGRRPVPPRLAQPILKVLGEKDTK